MEVILFIFNSGFGRETPICGFGLLYLLLAETKVLKDLIYVFTTFDI